MKNTKKLFAFLFLTLFALSLLAPLSVSAANDVKVADNADLFTDEEEAEINALISKAIASYNFDIVVVTTSNTNGKDTSLYADDYFDDNGYGIGTHRDGILFLIDMQNREYFISTSGRAIDYFDTGRTDDALDDIYPYMSGRDYAGAAKQFVRCCERNFANPDSDPDYVYDPNTGKIVRNLSLRLNEIVIAVVIAVACLFIFRGVVIKNYKGNKKADNYALRENSTLELTLQNERLINKVVTSRRRPRDTSSSGRSGGGGGRTSSSGRSHGGGGRSF